MQFRSGNILNRLRQVDGYYEFVQKIRHRIRNASHALVVKWQVGEFSIPKPRTGAVIMILNNNDDKPLNDDQLFTSVSISSRSCLEDIIVCILFVISA